MSLHFLKMWNILLYLSIFKKLVRHWMKLMCKYLIFRTVFVSCWTKRFFRLAKVYFIRKNSDEIRRTKKLLLWYTVTYDTTLLPPTSCTIFQSIFIFVWTIKNTEGFYHVTCDKWFGRFPIIFHLITGMLGNQEIEMLRCEQSDHVDMSQLTSHYISYWLFKVNRRNKTTKTFLAGLVIYRAGFNCWLMQCQQLFLVKWWESFLLRWNLNGM